MINHINLRKSLINYNEQLPPQNNLAEEILLGGILLQRQVIKIVIQELIAESFVIEANQLIYRTIVDIYLEYNYIDSIILINTLWQLNLLSQIGGINKILNLLRQAQIFMSKNITTKKVEYYLQVVQEKYFRRLLIQYSYNIIQLSHINSIPKETIIFKIENYFSYIKQLFLQEQKNNTSILLNTLVFNLQSEHKHKNKSGWGIKTGFNSLDRITSGLNNSDLIIIAGRPSMGKTSLSLNIALNMLKQNYNGIFIFSLEMPKHQILYKLLSMECKISLQKIISNKINNTEWDKIQKAGNTLIQSKLNIDDTANLSLSTLKIKASTLHNESPLNLIIIDYLQLLQLNNQDILKRSEELSLITRSLKLLAKELHIPIILLSQLNRNVEARLEKRPILSDLRESGCLEFNTKIITDKFPIIYNAFYHSHLHNNLCLTHNLHIKKTSAQYSYLLSNYTSQLIQLTHNHYLLTRYGWQKTDNLKYLSSLQYKKNFHNYKYQRIHTAAIKSKSPMYDIEVYENKCLNTNHMIYTHNSIEQDADLVLFLYRDSYYNDKTTNKKLTEIIVAKHRNGALGTAQLNFNDTFTSFTNLEE